MLTLQTILYTCLKNSRSPACDMQTLTTRTQMYTQRPIFLLQFPTLLNDWQKNKVSKKHSLSTRINYESMQRCKEEGKIIQKWAEISWKLSHAKRCPVLWKKLSNLAKTNNTCLWYNWMFFKTNVCCEKHTFVSETYICFLTHMKV